MNPKVDRVLLAWLILCGLIALAWCNALHADFTYDDRIEVIGNRTIRSATEWQEIFSYNWSRPIVLASYAFNFRISPTDPFGYHLFDLLLQAANAGFAFLLIRELLLLNRNKTPLLIAFFTAAIWAIHPLATESVTYITGRSEQLLAFFYLYGGWLWTRWLRKGGVLLFLGAWAAVIGAGLCKESAATLPVFYFLIDYLLRPKDSPAAQRHWAILPGIVLFVGFLGLRWMLEGTIGHPNPQRDIQTQILTQGEVLWRYAGLFVLPIGQSIFHDHPEAGLSVKPLLALTGWLAVLGFAYRKRKSDPIMVLGFGLFLLAMAPTFFVPLRETMAEHRTYVGSLGLALMTAYSLAAFNQRIQLYTSSILVVLLLTATHLRNKTWVSEVDLWADAAQKNPTSRDAHYGHGEAQRFAITNERYSTEEIDDIDPIGAYERALEIDPTHINSLNNIGIVYSQQLEFEKAQKAWQSVLKIDPKNCRAHINLGKTKVDLDDDMGALKELMTARTYCKENPMPHYFLGLLFDPKENKLNNPDKAIFHYQQLLLLDSAFGCPFGKKVEGQRCIAEEIRENLNRLTW